MSTVPCLFQCTFAGCLGEPDVALRQTDENQVFLVDNPKPVVVQGGLCPACRDRLLDAPVPKLCYAGHC